MSVVPWNKISVFNVCVFRWRCFEQLFYCFFDTKACTKLRGESIVEYAQSSFSQFCFLLDFNWGGKHNKFELVKSRKLVIKTY